MNKLKYIICLIVGHWWAYEHVVGKKTYPYTKITVHGPCIRCGERGTGKKALEKRH